MKLASVGFEQAVLGGRIVRANRDFFVSSLWFERTVVRKRVGLSGLGVKRGVLYGVEFV